MDSIVVRPLNGKKDINTFIRFQWKIYKNFPAWVPPLMMDRKKLIDREKHPFYKHAAAEFFLAERDGIVVGRIGAIVSENHIQEHHEQVGFFGFFECVDDQAVANALLDTARTYLRDHGMKAMRGPVSPSVNDELGLLIEGFDLSPTISMTYNPPYYLPLLEKYGLTKVKDLYAYDLAQATVYTERLERANEVVRKRQNLVIRSLDMKNFDHDVTLVKEIYTKAWEKNWGAVPMTDEEMDAMAADLKQVAVPELILFAEVAGKTIGVAITLPDINQALIYNKNGYLIPALYHLLTKKKKIDKVRIMVLGVIPEYRKSGAGGVLFYETAKRALKLGYKYGEASWILEDNVMMNKAAEAMNGVINRKYRLLQMDI